MVVCLFIQWLELLYSMLRETEWERDGYIPSMDEYMKNGYISFGLGPVVLTTLYLVGPKLSEEMVHHPNYSKLFKMMSTCARLLNDLCTYQVTEAFHLWSKIMQSILLFMFVGGTPIWKFSFIYIFCSKKIVM